VFDPWLAQELEVEREEEAWLRSVAAQRPRAERKRITHKSSPEEVAAFRAAVQQESETLEERVEARLEEIWTPREARFATDLERLWEEAVWINQTGQFPDGRPLRQQKRIMLQVWGLFLNAINRRMYGGKDEDGGEDAYPALRAPLPADASVRMGEGEQRTADLQQQVPAPQYET